MHDSTASAGPKILDPVCDMIVAIDEARDDGRTLEMDGREYALAGRWARHARGRRRAMAERRSPCGVARRERRRGTGARRGRGGAAALGEGSAACPRCCRLVSRRLYSGEFVRAFA